MNSVISRTPDSMGKWKPYPEYKDSGVAWLGEIPAGWTCARIASTAKQITNGYVGPTRDILLDKGVKYLQSLHIKNNAIVFKEDYFVSEAWSIAHSRSILNTGDVVVVQTGDIGQAACITKEFESANCHALIIIKPISEMLFGRYLAYVLNSSYGYNALKSIQTGALHPHLNSTHVRNVFLAFPEVQEQNRIVLFLDHRTAKIDTLIAKKTRQIELLKERRIALISHVVTKGLVPTVEMKDSGIAWLGKIPVDWVPISCRRILRVLTDFTANGSFAGLAENVMYLRGDGYSRLVRLTDLRKNLAVSEDSVFVDKHAHFYLMKSELLGGELLVANVGAYAGIVRKMPHINAKATLGPNMFLLRFSKLFCEDFAYWLFTSKPVYEQLMVAAISTAQPKLNKDNIRETKLVMPPPSEQQAIANFLDHETAKIDTLIAKIQEHIGKLKEYRTALISAAVTGKIDVRQAAKQFFENQQALPAVEPVA